RDRAQVEQLVQYIIKDPPEDADSKHTYKYTHEAVFHHLVDLIGITSIMEYTAEVNANAAEVLMAIIRNTPSALAAKLSSQRFLSCYFILDRC
ncbi:hypothetical protein GW17_00053643, partial [Ensete ventricosum]